MDMDEGQQRGWSKIPGDIILCHILPRLSNIYDRKRFKVVCSNWNSISKQEPDLFEVPRIPWVMVPSGVKDSKSFGEQHQLLYNIVDKKAYKVNIPEMKPVLRVVSSSPDGWLLYLDEAMELHALNLITRKTILLPSITTFPEIVGVQQDHQGRITAYNYIDEFSPEGFELPFTYLPGSYYLFRRAVIIPPSTSFDGRDDSDNRHIVIVLHDCTFDISYAREGDKSWTPMCNVEAIGDIVLHRGCIYAVDTGGTPYKISFATNTLTTYKGGEVEGERQDGTEVYLVVIEDELWRIWWDPETTKDDIARERQDTNIHPCDTRITVKVYLAKLDTNRAALVKMTSIGHHVVFLGVNYPVVLSTNDFPEFEANCIYFMDDTLEFFPFSSVYGMGVFNLTDKSFKPYCDSSIWSHFWPPPCWVWMPFSYDFKQVTC